MADARELPLWYNHVWLGYLNIKKCRSKQAPFIFDLNHAPIYVDDFCRQTGLKRTTWRQSIHVEKTDGDIVPALPLITPPNILHSPVRQGRRRPTASSRRARAAPTTTQAAPPTTIQAAPPTTIQAAPPAVNYFSGRLFSIARPPSQEAREAAHEAAAAYLAEVDAREAGRIAQEARAAVAETMISSREMHLISLADTAGLPTSATREEKVCVICHEGLLCGQRLAATGCGHVFCAGCISMGLRHHDFCPTCRTQKPTVTVLYI